MSDRSNFNSDELIGSKVYTALRPLRFPGGRTCQKLVSVQQQHAMLFVERAGSPDKLLRYELGKLTGNEVTMTEMPRYELPPNAIAHTVNCLTPVRVCDVTREAIEFAAYEYRLFEGIRRRFSPIHKETLTDKNNCQAFLDYMIYWLTGDEFIGPNFFYAALRPLKLPGGRTCKELVSEQQQHAMLFVERAGSPDKLLRYELGEHTGSAVTMTEVPGSELPPNAIELRVSLPRPVRLCDVTRKANQFAASEYRLFEGIRRRFSPVHKETLTDKYNSQTFLDYMTEWLTGNEIVATHMLIIEKSQPLLPLVAIQIRVLYTIYENVVYRVSYIVYNDTYTMN